MGNSGATDVALVHPIVRIPRLGQGIRCCYKRRSETLGLLLLLVSLGEERQQRPVWLGHCEDGTLEIIPITCVLDPGPCCYGWLP